MKAKPSGLYVHIPFCVQKCNYCDFCSFADVDSSLRSEYIESLVHEIRLYKREEKISIDSIFFGGGTPSLLCGDEFRYITSAIYDTFEISKDVEFTIEANPKTLNSDNLSAYVECGVNRVSIGVQTVHENERKILGRIHNFEDFKKSYELVSRSGITNISFDLMYGIPKQTLSSFTETLRTVLKLKPSHISCYSLILEEGTSLYRNRNELEFPSEDSEYEMYNACSVILSEYGFSHYEISNYALFGYESRHNLKYWHLDEYIGVGLAAHSFFEGKRFYNKNLLDVYLSRDPKKYSVSESVTQDDLAYEFVMLGLRTARGISLKEYESRFKINFLDGRAETIDRFIDLGYMSLNEDFLSLTEKGFYVSNTILTELL